MGRKAFGQKRHHHARVRVRAPLRGIFQRTATIAIIWRAAKEVEKEKRGQIEKEKTTKEGRKEVAGAACTDRQTDRSSIES